jgi:uncharacterized protein YggU (UPF0235/DUF167 family)
MAKIQSKIGVKVKAGALENRVYGEFTLEGKRYLKIEVTARASDGRANSATISLLASYWKIPKSCIEISSGFTSSFKIISVKDCDLLQRSHILA